MNRFWVRSVWVVALVGSTSAWAATDSCYFRTAKDVCRKGTVFEDADHLKHCKAGEEMDIAYYRNLSDCRAQKNGSIPSTDGTSKKIAADACFYLAPQASGKSVCVKGTVSPENAGLCGGGGSTVSRFYMDAACKKKAKITACWTYAPGKEGQPEKCDSEHVGTFSVEGEVALCKVGTQYPQQDFFFDNHCEVGSLGWNFEDHSRIPESMTADSTRTKIVPIAPQCAADEIYDSTTQTCVSAPAGKVPENRTPSKKRMSQGG